MVIRHAQHLPAKDLASAGEHPEQRDPFDRLLVCESQVEPLSLFCAIAEPPPSAFDSFLPQRLQECDGLDRCRGNGIEQLDIAGRAAQLFPVIPGPTVAPGGCAQCPSYPDLCLQRSASPLLSAFVSPVVAALKSKIGSPQDSLCWSVGVDPTTPNLVTSSFSCFNHQRPAALKGSADTTSPAFPG